MESCTVHLKSVCGLVMTGYSLMNRHFVRIPYLTVIEMQNPSAPRAIRQNKNDDVTGKALIAMQLVLLRTLEAYNPSKMNRTA